MIMNNEKNFAWPVTSISYDDYEAFEDWYCSFGKGYKGTYIIWGAGIRGTEFYYFFKEKEINNNILFTDTNSEKWNGYIEDSRIISPNDAINMVNRNVAKIIISVENYQSIESGLELHLLKKEEQFFVIDSKMYDKYIEEFCRNYNNKYLLMGDCEFSTISIHDNDKRDLAKIMASKMHKQNLKVLAMHGMGLRSHYYIYKTYLRLFTHPKVLGIMINFDTLNGKQHLLPRSQHEELLRGIFALCPNDNEEFKDYLKEVHLRSKNLNAEFYTKKGSQSSKAKIRNYFRFNYLYKLDSNIEGLQYLRKMIALSKDNNIKVLAFVPPINYELGKEIFGRTFIPDYNDNVNIIKEILKDYGIKLLDLSFILSKDCFAEPDTPDETTNERGREKVADVLQKEMELLGNV